MGSWFWNIIRGLGLVSDSTAVVATSRDHDQHLVQKTRLVQQLHAWEAAMTPEEKQRAFQYMEANGWRPGMLPPPYAWAEAFRHAAPSKQPPVPVLH